jgi:hypothetical protein
MPPNNSDAPINLTIPGEKSFTHDIDFASSSMGWVVFIVPVMKNISANNTCATHKEMLSALLLFVEVIFFYLLLKKEFKN